MLLGKKSRKMRCNTTPTSPERGHGGPGLPAGKSPRFRSRGSEPGAASSCSSECCRGRGDGSWHGGARGTLLIPAHMGDLPLPPAQRDTSSHPPDPRPPGKQHLPWILRPHVAGTMILAEVWFVQTDAHQQPQRSLRGRSRGPHRAGGPGWQLRPSPQRLPPPGPRRVGPEDPRRADVGKHASNRNNQRGVLEASWCPFNNV